MTNLTVTQTAVKFDYHFFPLVPPEGEQANSLQASPAPPDPAPQISEIVEIEEERSHSSSPSSLFSIPADEDTHLLSQLEGVLREGTATPSESQGGRDQLGRGVRDDSGTGNETKGNREEETPDNHDMNSEPEVVSSMEEDTGEDDQTLVENLSLKLEEEREVQDPSAAPSPGEEASVRLAVLRKLLLARLVQNVGLLEGVGGMRSMCYLQVSGLFIRCLGKAGG